MRNGHWLFLLLLPLAVSGAAAQSKTGTAIGEFTLIEPSARIAAMGNAGVAVNDGLQSAYYNPAAIGGFKKPGVQFTHSEWLAGINYEYVAAALPFRYFGSLFASVTALNSGDMEVRTVTQPLGTGELFQASDVALGLGYGRTITDRFAAGVQANYLTETIWHTSLHTFTFNFGTVYRLTDDGLQLGASIVNFGAQGRFRGRDLRFQYDASPDTHGDNGALPGERETDDFPVPVLFRLGLSYPKSLGERTGTLRFVADAFHASSSTERVSGGVEWQWQKLLALRAGYQNLGQTKSETGLTAGLGLNAGIGGQAFDFDYAWADHGRLDQAHRFTLVLHF